MITFDDMEICIHAMQGGTDRDAGGASGQKWMIWVPHMAAGVGYIRARGGWRVRHESASGLHGASGGEEGKGYQESHCLLLNFK